MSNGLAIALVPGLVSLLGLTMLACQSDADSQADAEPLADASVADATPQDLPPPDARPSPDAAVRDAAVADAASLDQGIDARPPPDAAAADMALPDADPRSQADLWAPDFGPPPADMPESIRWMHGRMWCPDPRPPRTMPDGTSECEWVDVPTPRDQLNPPDSGGPWGAFACYGWPHRTSDEPYQVGDHFGPFVSCNPDRSLCCSFQETRLAPCGWTTCEGIWSAFYFEQNPDAPDVVWLQENGLEISLPTGVNCPQDMLDAFPTALNNCHHQCKAPACE